MSNTPYTLPQIKQAIQEGRSDELNHQRVQLTASPDCTLNCGAPNTPSLEATLVGFWPNHDNTELVLDLREISFGTPDGTKGRGEALAYVRVDPPTPKPSEE
jgi:hypothetical protein